MSLVKYEIGWVEFRSSEHPILELLVLLARTWECVLEEARDVLVPEDSAFSVLQKLERRWPYRITKSFPAMAVLARGIGSTMVEGSAHTTLPQLAEVIRLLRGHAMYSEMVCVFSKWHAVIFAPMVWSERMRLRFPQAYASSNFVLREWFETAKGLADVFLQTRADDFL